MRIEVLIILSFLFILLAGFIILIFVNFNRRSIRFSDELRHLKEQENRRLLQATIDTQENERKRIGSNIHDDIGPLLSLLKLQVLKLKSHEQFDDKISSIIEHLDMTINNVRLISKNLSPSLIYELGFDEAIQDLVGRFSEASDAEIHYHNRLSLDDMHDKVKLSIFRIIQEGINNIIKHSNAQNVNLNLFRTVGQVNIHITDDGIGFDPENISAGLGIKNMIARAKAMNAEIDIESDIGIGTSIILRVPINEIE